MSSAPSHVARYTTVMDSPVGVLTLVATDSGLCELSWEGDPHHRSLAAQANESATHPILAQAVRELREYFAGTRRTFGVAVEASGTAFQRDAWRALTTIPYGETISYGEQARRIGRPTAVRAIGGANGRNPVGIVVPCHRVIGADGSLTGFGGGMAAKSWLLAHERANTGG
jgi:methylated-DNA-[protein]-cysteine S-methyltransferase